jgi:hypothetical protein
MNFKELKEQLNSKYFDVEDAVIINRLFELHRKLISDEPQGDLSLAMAFEISTLCGWLVSKGYQVVEKKCLFVGTPEKTAEYLQSIVDPFTD